MHNTVCVSAVSALSSCGPTKFIQGSLERIRSSKRIGSPKRLGIWYVLSMPLTTIASPLSWRFRHLGSLGALIHYSESNAVVHCGKSCPLTSATHRFTDGFHHRFTDIGVLTGKTSVVVAGKRSLPTGVRSLVERDNELSRKGLVVERTRKFVVEESGARHRRRLL
ncbi:hypothetical protein C8J56DRAFT_945601 [Mycena floridula]|nr:hypothetical protein C8J56DRAFT_945601 [Mycena floridula]